MARIVVRMLGGFSAAKSDGTVLTFPTRKSEALLAVLLCRRGEPQSRERLASLLWGDRSDRQARHSLSQTLTSIRCVAGAELFVADRESIGLGPDAAEGDAADFLDLSSRDDATSLRVAMEIYRGPLLEGFRLRESAFDDWLSHERARFHRLSVSTLTKLAECELAEGHDEAATAALERALGLDPLSEEIHRRLMRLNLDRGLYNTAIRQYRDCVQLLKQELGTVPEPATNALYHEARTSLKATPYTLASPHTLAPPYTITAGAPVVTPPAPAAVPHPTRTQRPVQDRMQDRTQDRMQPGEQNGQDIRFCMTGDGVRIAFAISGQGAPLVKTANWLNHLEYDWHSPVWRHMLHGLSSEHQLIRYDERGNGLSDWDAADLSLEAMVHDLETVVDAAGLDRFPLLGISQGCAVAALYAIRHPERVSRLVLHGGYARGWRTRNDPAEIARREAMMTLVLQGWGQDNPAFRQVFTSYYIPDGTPEQMKWWNDLQRICTSPANAVRLMRELGNIDVRHLMPRVVTPTLVMHSRNDAAVPFAAGRELAALIPGARFVPLESRNHLILEQEAAWPRFLSEIRGFLNTEDDALWHRPTG